MSRTEYVVLIHGDETAWAEASEDERTATFARHAEFSRLLEERGHAITGGAELTHPASARLVREGAVTDGPYVEAAEQLGGFYTVATEDLPGLLEVCGVLAVGGDTIEVRACVDHSAGGGEAADAAGTGNAAP